MVLQFLTSLRKDPPTHTALKESAALSANQATTLQNSSDGKANLTPPGKADPSTVTPNHSRPTVSGP